MYNFTCRASQQTFNVRGSILNFYPRKILNLRHDLQDQNRVRYGIQKMQPLDFLAECHARLAYISQIRSHRA